MTLNPMPVMRSAPSSSDRWLTRYVQSEFSPRTGHYCIGLVRIAYLWIKQKSQVLLSQTHLTAVVWEEAQQHACFSISGLSLADKCRCVISTGELSKGVPPLSVLFNLFLDCRSRTCKPHVWLFSRASTSLANPITWVTDLSSATFGFAACLVK